MKAFVPTLLICITAAAHGAQSAPAKTAHSPVAADPISDPPDRPGAVTLDLYQNGFAYVRDERRLAIDAGHRTLELSGLPHGLDVTSLRATATGRTRVLATAWRPAPTSRAELLERWLGQRITLAPRAGVTASERTGTLIGVTGGEPVVQTAAGVELGGPDAPWRLVLPAKANPARAGLALTLEHEGSDQPQLTLSYLTPGLSWQADYRLAVSGDTATLSGYASLRNDTDVGYPHAHVALVAGDVHGTDNGGAPAAFQAQRAEKFAAAAPEPMGSWHVYPLGEPTGLPAGEVRRVPLLTRNGLAVHRQFVATGVGTQVSPRTSPAAGQAEPVAVRLDVDTAGDDAVPLPAGVVRVTEKDARGRPRFAGSDRITHTPAGRPFTVELGSAFDLTALRRQTDFQRLDERRFEAAWEITLHNAGERPADVRLVEQMSGDWTLIADGGEWKRRDANSLVRDVSLPPGRERTVGYRVRVTR